jgi:hypothetical protein
LLHTGAHKINNALAQALLARRMGKKRIIAETGAGQHGVATAAACAKFGLECVVYMGAHDMERQSLNVFRMRLMGAEVRGVEAGQKTLKEAINEAMRDWVTNVRSTHYILGTAYGSHPYPMMVRDFHRVIGQEAKEQILAREGRLPDELVACVGGGSNAIGLFFEFLEEPNVRMTGVEAGGHGIKRGEHAARFAGGRLGVLQGCKTFLLQDAEGQIELTHSVSAGLDYAAVGPEHARLAWIIVLMLVVSVCWLIIREHSKPPFDPAFDRLSPVEVARLPLATRFDTPMGSEHGALTYNAQPFRINRHLGDDLNGIGGLNSDLGDAVYASGFGRVVYVGVPGPGWGKMVILSHRVREAEKTRVIQTVYAHLDQILVKQDQVVQRGEKIGTVGTADGQYLAHLHFEVREGPYVNPGVGYADAPLNRLSPERFLVEHRGAGDDLLNPAPTPK